MILSSDNEKELQYILDMLNYTEVKLKLKDKLKSNKELHRNVSEIVNKLYDTYGKGEIIASIKYILLMKELGMDTTFKEIYEQYQWNDSIPKEGLIKKFCNILFGNNGKNLQVILSSNLEQELICISDMLNKTEVMLKLKDKLTDNDTLNNIALEIVNE